MSRGIICEVCKKPIKKFEHKEIWYKPIGGKHIGKYVHSKMCRSD